MTAKPMTANPQVVYLYTTESAGRPMTAHEQVLAVAGQGLEGDRYALGRGRYSDRPQPERQITLIQEETLHFLREEHGIDLLPEETRRNVVTSGIALNDLVGVRFYVGTVLLEAVRLCVPCGYLADLTGKPVLKPLVNRGGINAIILEGGAIKVGDAIVPVEVG